MNEKQNAAIKKEGQPEKRLMVSTGAKNLDELQAFVKKNAKVFTGVTGRGSSLISIVSSKSGTRFTISKSVNERLGFPKKIYIGFLPNQLMIFDAEGTDLPAFEIKQEHSRVDIYNKKLVDQVIKDYSLDFTGISSKSFSDGCFEDAVKPILYVNML